MHRCRSPARIARAAGAAGPVACCRWSRLEPVGAGAATGSSAVAELGPAKVGGSAGRRLTAPSRSDLDRRGSRASNVSGRRRWGRKRRRRRPSAAEIAGIAGTAGISGADVRAGTVATATATTSSAAGTSAAGRADECRRERCDRLDRLGDQRFGRARSDTDAGIGPCHGRGDETSQSQQRDSSNQPSTKPGRSSPHTLLLTVGRRSFSILARCFSRVLQVLNLKRAESPDRVLTAVGTDGSIRSHAITLRATPLWTANRAEKEQIRAPARGVALNGASRAAKVCPSAPSYANETAACAPVLAK